MAMTLKRTLILLGAAAMTAALFLCVGCGGSQAKAPATVIANELDGAPCWVTKGGSCYGKDGDKAKFVWGVGSVAGTRNVGLAREAALGRARTDIARSLQTRVEAMLKDYQATTTGGEQFGTAAADDQHIVDVSKQITDLTLSGTEMVDSWISSSGAFWVLARLDVDGFKDAVGRMNQLNEAVRQAVVERADKAFSELDKEIEAQGGK
jgi:hypothetical protein